MGYIIDKAGAGGLEKFETFVPSADVNLLNVNPYPLNISVIPNKVFCITNAFIQYDGPAIMNNFFYMWIVQGILPCCTYDTRGAIPTFGLNNLKVANFLVNINVDITGIRNYGSNVITNQFFLKTDNILAPRNGNILITTYGYYFDLMPPFV